MDLNTLNNLSSLWSEVLHSRINGFAMIILAMLIDRFGQTFLKVA